VNAKNTSEDNNYCSILFIEHSCFIY